MKTKKGSKADNVNASQTKTISPVLATDRIKIKMETVQDQIKKLEHAAQQIAIELQQNIGKYKQLVELLSDEE